MTKQHISSPLPAAQVLFALAVGGFAIGTTEFATMSVLPFMAHGLGVSEPVAGHLISLYALGVVVGAPLIAITGARLSRRTLLLLLMGFFSLAHLGTMLAPNFGAMMLMRFLSGLPHGAYFGVGALVAASLVPLAKRAQAVGMMMIGLTVATIVGVPLTSWLAQALGWRMVFLVVALLAALTVVLIACFLPQSADVGGNSRPIQELTALKNSQIWLTLAIGAIGFGGLFAVYTYLPSTLTQVTGVSPRLAPLVLAIFGVGMTLGNIVVPPLAGKRPMLGVAGLLLWSVIWLAIYPFTTGNIWLISAMVVPIGMGGAIGTILQIRLMDVAQEAQTMAAALNHSAFNAANALGPFLGGWAIEAGWGWSSTGWVGSALALAGLLMWMLTVWLGKKTGVPPI